MKKHSVMRRLAAAAVLLALLVLPCGCGEDENTNDIPFTPAISSTDVSDSDVSGSDVSESDVSFSDVSTSDSDWFSANEAEVTGPVYTLMLNAEAINARNINVYMGTIDPDSDSYDSTREDAEYAFAHYRLTVSVNDVEIKEMKGDTAIIEVTQTTSALVMTEENEAVSGSDVSPSDVSASDVSGSDAAPLTGKDLSDSFVPCQTVLRHTMTCIDNVWYITSTVPVSYTALNAE